MMQVNPNKKPFWACVVGNVLDHYDTALYGLLAPLFAPLFFPREDLTISLLLTYLLMSTTLLSKPLGALFFGRFALKKSPKNALTLSLLGLALTTGLMGILPSYSSIGPWAPVGLALLRLVQGFFASGEQSVASIFLVDQADEAHRGKASSFYHASTIAGILLASLLASLVTMSHNPNFWRLPFIAGLFTGLLGLILRGSMPQTSTFSLSKPLKISIHTHKWNLLRIFFASSFTYLTYCIPFVFLNGFVPLITSITLAEMLKLNTLLLMLDFCLLPLFGFLSDYIDKTKMMGISALLLTASIIPLFFFLPGAKITTISLIRIWIVLLGLAFLAPLQAWFLTLLSKEQSYQLCGFGYTLGSELFGKTTPAICLFLWHQFHSPLAPAVYITALSFAASLSVLSTLKKPLPHSA
jgi:MFS family permease